MSVALCVVAGCRIRGRHRPDCAADPDHPCTGCLPRPTDGAYACDVCTDARRRDLEVIADMAPAARDVAYGFARHGDGASLRSGPASRVPIDLATMAKLEAVHGALSTWCRHISETRGVTLPEGLVA